MSHLILHIGTHKTGSTTIQDTFSANSKYLAKRGLIYPKLNYRHSGHHGLIAESVALPKTFHLESGETASLEHINERYSRGNQTVFLSSEEFSRAEGGKSVNFAQLCKLLNGFDRISVLCFVRPQWRFLQSIYLEISRPRSPPRPPKLVEEAIETGRCQGLHMDYMDLLKRLSAVFSPSDITLVDFEAARQKNGGLIAAALAIAGVQVDISDLKAVKNGHSNQSPHGVSQWAANLLAEPYSATTPIIKAVQKTLKPVIASCVLTRHEIAEMNSAFAASNQTLLEARAAFQPEFQLSDPPLPNDCMFREDVTIEHWLGIGRELARQQFS